MLTTTTLTALVRSAFNEVTRQGVEMKTEKTGFIQFTRNVLWAGESFAIGDIRELSEKECIDVVGMNKGILLTEDQVSKIEEEQELALHDVSQ